MMNNAVVMPSYYNVVSEDEMVYLDGGNLLDIFDPSQWNLSRAAENLVVSVGSWAIWGSISFVAAVLLAGGSITTEVGKALSFQYAIQWAALALCIGCAAYAVVYWADNIVKALNTEYQMSGQAELASNTFWKS